MVNEYIPGSRQGVATADAIGRATETLAAKTRSDGTRTAWAGDRLTRRRLVEVSVETELDVLRAGH